MMNSTMMRTTVLKINKFYASNAAFITFSTATILFGIVQVLLFIFGGLKINGTTYIDSSHKDIIFVWVSLTLSILSCLAGFIGAILSLRGSTLFIWPSLFQLTMQIFVAISSAVWLTAIAVLFSIIITIVRYILWKLGTLDKIDINPKKVMIYVAIIGVIIFSVFTFLEVKFEWLRTIPSVDESNDLFVKDIVWGVFDAISSSLVMMANVLFLFKIRWSFVLYLTSKIFSIANYSHMGNFIPVVQLLLFSTMDITGFLAWSMHLVKEEFQEIT